MQYRHGRQTNLSQFFVNKHTVGQWVLFLFLGKRVFRESEHYFQGFTSEVKILTVNLIWSSPILRVQQSIFDASYIKFD